jgi:hypothetical protein
MEGIALRIITNPELRARELQTIATKDTKDTKDKT